MYCVCSFVASYVAANLKTPPSGRQMVAMSASQRRATDFEQRVEHGLQIEGRAADDLEYVGCRGLLPQRFGQVLRAPLHFFEQARVLDRDHGLVGECLDKLDLFICERSRRATRDHEDADRNPVTQHGHAKGRAKCTQLLCFR